MSSSAGTNNANSKARKSLASNWAPHDDSFSAPETPSKSLVGTSDASMLFSPPGILKETLPDDSGFDSHRGIMSSNNLAGNGSNSLTTITIKQEDLTENSANPHDPLAVNTSIASTSRSPPKSKARKY